MVVVVVEVVVFVVSFMQDIYSYIPETNHVSRVYIFALFCMYILRIT